MSQEPLFWHDKPGTQTGHPGAQLNTCDVHQGGCPVVPSGARLHTVKGHPKNTDLTRDDTSRVPSGAQFSLSKYTSRQVTSVTDNMSRAGEEFSETAQTGHPGHPDPLIPTTLRALKNLMPHPGWRGVTPRKCTDCKRIVLVGVDADRCAVIACIDWAPLDAATEATALLAGRPTYELRSGQPWTLTRRWSRLIASHHPGGRDWRGHWDVVPAHVCNAPPLPSIASALMTPPTPTPTDDTCPF